MESIAKLTWRCRRGTKELDYLLNDYLTQYFPQATKEEQGLFIRLLEYEDTLLINFLLGDLLPESEGLSLLVKKIRQ